MAAGGLPGGAAGPGPADGSHYALLEFQLQELSKSHQRLETRSEENHKALEKTLAALPGLIAVENASVYVRQDLARATQDANDAHFTAVDKALSALEERMTFASRTAITGVILPIIVSIVLALLLLIPAGKDEAVGPTSTSTTTSESTLDHIETVAEEALP